MSKSQARIRSLSPAPLPRELGERSGRQSRRSSSSVGRAGASSSIRVGDSPVEFVPKSILRKASVKFSSNSLHGADSTCSNSSSRRSLINNQYNGEDSIRNEGSRGRKTTASSSTKSILKRPQQQSESKAATSQTQQQHRRSRSPSTSERRSSSNRDEDGGTTVKGKDTNKARSSCLFPNNEDALVLDSSNENDGFGDEVAMMMKKNKSPPPDLNNNNVTMSVMNVNENEPMDTSGGSSSRSSKAQRNSRRGILLLPEQIYSKIFSLLNPIELHNCTQVCKLWRDYYNIFYNTPRIFNGRNSFWGTTRSKSICRLFLTHHLLSPENRRHFTLLLYNVSNPQMKTIICDRPEDFQSGVKHMTKLHLTNCNFHWQSLITLLTSLPHLNTFTDSWSTHFQTKSCGYCVSCTCCCFGLFCQRLHTKQGSLKKLPDKLKLNELKNSYTRIRIFKINRHSFQKELCAYFHVIFRMIPYLEDFQFNVGPWETPKDSVRATQEWFREFCRIFQQGIRRVRRTVKKIKISWKDEGMEDLFDNCVEILHQIEFPKLAELSLQMGDSSMKNPKNLPKLVKFFNDFQWKPGKTKFLHLKSYIAPIYMRKQWMDMFHAVQDRILRGKFHVSLRVGVKLEDNTKTVHNNNTPSTVSNIFGNYVFFRGLQKLHVDIKGETTQSLREVIPGIRATFPNVENLEIKIGDRKPGVMFAFRDYSIISIAFNFKLITELRISDQPGRKWDLPDMVIGQTERASITYAYISKRDMVLLCEMLTRLRVLQLWANLIDLRDINFTGIQSNCYFLRSDGQFYLNKAWLLKEKREPSIQNLKHLRLLSLRGLGKDITDITCSYAFEGMPQLQYLELTGDTSITQVGRMRLHRRMQAIGCKVNFCR